MAKTKQKTTKESDSLYFLKLVMYLILGSLWMKVSDGQNFQLPIPVGLLVGIVYASHDHFQIDRKIEYAVLLVATLIGFWAPFGIYLAL